MQNLLSPCGRADLFACCLATASRRGADRSPTERAAPTPYRWFAYMIGKIFTDPNDHRNPTTTVDVTPLRSP